MPVFAGPMLLRKDTVDAWVEVERGRVLDWGKGEPSQAPLAEGWIVPAPVNAHTHVGDAFLAARQDKPRDLAALVGPGGWKHQHLASADAAQQSLAAQAHVEAMARAGTAAFIDFREGGIQGVRWLRALELDARPVIYGRPASATFDEEEAEGLLRQVDGIGLSGVRDHEPDVLEDWAAACHDSRRRFALHVSEARHDPIDDVLALEPTYVVHMCQGRRSEFEELAQQRVPIVACPRSNAWFGLKTPVKAMLEAGCTVALGTDNAMLHDGNVLSEAAAVHAQGVPVEEALRMATYHGRDLAALPDPLPPARGMPADLVVLPLDVLDGAPRGKPRVEGL